MIYLLHLGLGLLLVVAKTASLDLPIPLPAPYDPIVCQAAYLALFRPVREGAIVLPVLGVVMDSLCGGPFGLHFTVYLGLYVAIRWIPRYLEAGNILLWAGVSGAAVLVENILFFTASVFSGAPGAPHGDFSGVLLSALSAFATGWLLIGGLKIVVNRAAGYQEERRSLADPLSEN